MRHRYLDNPNPGSANVPSILYYDDDGTFCGVENGVDFRDSDEFLQMKWWEIMLRPPECKKLKANQVEVDALTHKAAHCDEGSDEHGAPEGKNHC